MQNLGDSASLWNDNKDKILRNISNDESSPAITSGVTGGNSKDPTSWDVDVFIEALHLVVPDLKPQNVFEKFDHKGFVVKDKASLKLLVRVIQ